MKTDKNLRDKVLKSKREITEETKVMDDFQDEYNKSKESFIKWLIN